MQILSVPLRAAPTGDMLQKKTDELLTGMPNVFSMADDILIAGFDMQDKHHNETLNKVLQV